MDDSSLSEEQPPPPLLLQSPRKEEESHVYKTKTIQFFNSTTPIILQNDNGPCPLLAICNVLLLRNQLDLGADIGEVKEDRLVTLVAERIIDSNSNTEIKGSEYVQNQERNIADAIDLVPRLRTGIDVNVIFDRIDHFEYTRECAIFDLLGIRLYHGWLVDEQDHATATAFGSKSYNTITKEVVYLQEMAVQEKDKSVEDSVDFAAATAATLGVPSPCLLKAKSFNESPRAVPDESDVKPGDVLEAEELLRVLKFSEHNSSIQETDCIAEHVSSDEHLDQMQILATSSEDKLLEDDLSGRFQEEPSISGGNDLTSDDQLGFIQSEGSLLDNLINFDSGPCDQNETKTSLDSEIDFISLHKQDTQLQPSTDALTETKCPTPNLMDSDLQSDFSLDAGLGEKIYKDSGIQHSTVLGGPSDSPSGNILNVEATGSFNSSLNDSEPIYEGEECIFDSVATVCEDQEPIYEGEGALAKQGDAVSSDVHTSVCEDQEPIYEGEGVLAKQGDGVSSDLNTSCSKGEITSEEGELIINFLNNNASQLTFHGLFSLQSGVGDKELCVFFRNNHFSTMFKYEDELYLLITDQGYLNQPGIVWEKLNEVNGDSVFYDSAFKEFRPDSEANCSWDEQNVLASTADYLASVGKSEEDGSSINSDLQLAIALQQQEFEQQQPQRRAPPQQPPASGVAGGSRLITGPQTSTRPSTRPTTSSPKQDKKKDACSIM